MADSLTKYVNIHGPCEIRIRELVSTKDEAGRSAIEPDAVVLELYFYDKEAKKHY